VKRGLRRRYGRTARDYARAMAMPTLSKWEKTGSSGERAINFEGRNYLLRHDRHAGRFTVMVDRGAHGKVEWIAPGGRTTDAIHMHLFPTALQAAAAARKFAEIQGWS
jgi:hypothetical protein